MRRSARGAHVLVFGSGVAGLSAAHELAERGVRETLVEAAAGVGGKARSVGKAGTGSGGRRDARVYDHVESVQIRSRRKSRGARARKGRKCDED